MSARSRSMPGISAYGLGVPCVRPESASTQMSAATGSSLAASASAGAEQAVGDEPAQYRVR